MEAEAFSIGYISLIRALEIQKFLQSQGTIRDKIKIGCGEDTALRGDIDSEETVINFFKEIKFPTRVYAEEHGVIDITKKPRFLTIIDGIDGSSGLASDINARCGTILAIAPNLNPIYSDFIFAGITEFSTDRILYASSLFQEEVKLRLSIQRTDSIKKQNRLSKRTGSIYVDDPILWEKYENGITSGLDEIGQLVHNIFTERLKSKFNLSGLTSSSSMCLDLVLGEVDAICGVRAKGVYEPPGEYLLLKNIGGTVVEVDGKNIGNRYWLKDRGKLAPLIRASSPIIAKEIIDIVNKKQIN
jgi:fructose-1,6-bisphosphatase/inositol monophosphatase family enzyme